MIAPLDSIFRLFLLRKLNARELHVLIIFLLFGFTVIVDLVNGFMIQVLRIDLTLGVLYRGLAFVLMLPFVLLLKKFWVKLFIALLVGFWLLESLIWVEASADYQLIRESVIFLKFLYAWVIYSYLTYITSRYDISVEYVMQCLIFFGTVAGTSILLSYFSGYGISTYERTTTFAVKSYFNAQNDIGLAILLSLVFCMYFLLRYGEWMYGIYAMLMMAGLILLGTRAGLVGGFATLGAFTFLFIAGIADTKKRSGKRMVLIGSMVLAIIGGLIYAVSEISEYRYLTEKYTTLFEGTPRETLEGAAKRHFENRGSMATLLGEGTYTFRIGVMKYYTGTGKELGETIDASKGKAVEQDIYDVIGSYGMLLGGLLLLVVLMLFLKVLASLVMTLSLIDFTFFTAFGLLIGHSFLAGHALGSSTVAAVAGLIYYYAIECTKVSFGALRRGRVRRALD